MKSRIQDFGLKMIKKNIFALAVLALTAASVSAQIARPIPDSSLSKTNSIDVMTRQVQVIPAPAQALAAPAAGETAPPGGNQGQPGQVYERSWTSFFIGQTVSYDRKTYGAPSFNSIKINDDGGISTYSGTREISRAPAPFGRAAVVLSTTNNQATGKASQPTPDFIFVARPIFTSAESFYGLAPSKFEYVSVLKDDFYGF